MGHSFVIKTIEEGPMKHHGTNKTSRINFALLKIGSNKGDRIIIP
jgi:hypothetical protein